MSNVKLKLLFIRRALVAAFPISQQCYKFSIYRSKKTSFSAVLELVYMCIGTFERGVTEREVEEEKKKKKKKTVSIDLKFSRGLKN